MNQLWHIKKYSTGAILTLVLGWGLLGALGLAQTKISETTGETVLGPVELRASAIKTENYPVDLSTVLRLVENQNLTVAQARKGADISKTQLHQKQAAILPNIEGSYVQSRLEGAQQVFGTNVQVIRETVQL